MYQQVITVLHEGKFLTWRVKLNSYFLSIAEDILISVEYGIKDKSHDLDRNIILNGITKYNSKFMKNCETAREMLDKLQKLYLGG